MDLFLNLEDSGGMVTPATCTEQLLYEIHDPKNYITPDCIADFSGITFDQSAKDQVTFNGADGKLATGTYKVSVGYQNGFIGEGEISYGGANCLRRAYWRKRWLKKGYNYYLFSFQMYV